MYNRIMVHLAKGQGQPRSTGITPLIADRRRYSTRPRSLLVNGPRAEVEAVLKTVSILGLRKVELAVPSRRSLYNKRALSWEHLGIVTAST